MIFTSFDPRHLLERKDSDSSDSLFHFMAASLYVEMGRTYTLRFESSQAIGLHIMNCGLYWNRRAVEDKSLIYILRKSSIY